MNAPLNAESSRPLEGGPSFPLRHRLFRALWTVTWFLLASWTPAFLNSWRVAILRLFGAKIACGAVVHGSARIWYPPNLYMAPLASLGPGVVCYCMDRIEIGQRAVVSQRSHLCAGSHDIDDPNFQLIVAPITIGSSAWIASEAFVGPGVYVGEGAVLGARGVTAKNLNAWTVYVGNPARAIRPRSGESKHP
ncbi:putative colanic acid biosynthesis acetyltransferase [Prosthecomicrobium hirschii]|uniref:putative colanic acid biosynthesis acetyltransferase n=1 Tax=Prosthecodimorpha hirschii TaxID=665126 RepID=UPI00112738DD|nr:putative colanic acid biosynthesis acetyltransferase [Prosthecomicrobium hirschii]